MCAHAHMHMGKYRWPGLQVRMRTRKLRMVYKIYVPCVFHKLCKCIQNGVVYIHMHYTVAEMLQHLIIKINKLRHQTLVLSPFPLLELASSSVLMVDTEFSLLSIESESDVTTFCLFIEAGKQAAIAVHANTMLLNMMKIR